jgi:uncharacterized protein involved in type VI secretion and phage assembly
MRQVRGVVHGFIKRTDDPSKLGRVKLRFPWLGDDYESEWAHIASPMSGPSRGFFFSPEEGDEVLVGFDNGQVDHPYVIGFLYNGKQKPPETELKNRVILTPGGNTLRFEDKDGETKVILKSKSGHQIILDDTNKPPQNKYPRILVQTSGGLRIVLDDKDQSIELQGGGRILEMRNGLVKIS